MARGSSVLDMYLTPSRTLTARETQGTSGIDQFLNLIQNPFKSTFTENAFYASLATSLAVTAVIALFFSFLRPYNNVVYAPKVKHADAKHAPPQVGKGMFAWVKPIMRTKEAELVEKTGLDAAVFLRFTRMSRNMFLVMTLIGCGVMIPLNVLGSTKIGNEGTFYLMTPLNVWGNALWGHVACAYAFDAVVAYFLWWNYKAVTRLRRQYFESEEYQKSLHARTLMLTDIPASLRNDEGIARITEEVTRGPGIPHCAIGRNVKELPALIKEHDEAVKELEGYLAKYLKNPNNLPARRPTCSVHKNDPHEKHAGKVDAIDYLTGRIRDLQLQIKEVRDSIDKRNAMPYGFASYEGIAEAHNIAYFARNKHPQGTSVRLAPRPNDLIWDNLALTKGSRKRKRFVSDLWVAVLTFLYIAPNAMISIFLSDLSNLGLVWPAFQTQLEADPTLWAVIQGVASPALTSLIYLLLPIFFRRLSIRSGDLTKTSREKHVTHKLYAFFVFNNLLVFSLFSAVWQYVTAVINATDDNDSVIDAIKEGQIFVKIMTSLCTVSPFWLTWLLQRNLGAAADLAQMWTLIWTSFAKRVMSPTPRQLIEWTAPVSFDYASYYNYFLFYVTVALCFGTLQPLVLPITALYFGIDSWLKKYLLMYVFITKTESGGTFWRILFNRVLFASVLANCVIALILLARGSWAMVIAMAPLPVIMLLFKWFCSRTYDDQIKYYTKSTLKDTEALPLPTDKNGKRNDRLRKRFGHPALYKKLITPMVHAKSQHLLQNLIGDRLDPGVAVANSGYSDIHMDPMSEQEPGKKSVQVQGPNAAPFEVVDESHLDFEYFKNRDDFRDEGGDIYGRPLDMMTDRPDTPSTFAGGRTSPATSRSSSPAPSAYSRRPTFPMTDTAYRPSTANSANGYQPYRNLTPQRGPHPLAGGAGALGTNNRGLYRHADDSESGLLNAGAPMGVSGPGSRDPSLERSASYEQHPYGGDAGYGYTQGYGQQHYAQPQPQSAGWTSHAPWTGAPGYGNVPQDPVDENGYGSYDYYRGRQ